MINQLVRCPNPKRMMISSGVSEIIIEGKHATHRKISKVNLMYTMERLLA